MLARKRKFQDQVGVSESVTPNYAILKLKSDTNCIQLLQNALALGVADISFVSHPKEYFHPTEWSASPDKRTVYSPDDTFSQIEPRLPISDSPPNTGTIDVQTVRDEFSSSSCSNGSRFSSMSSSTSFANHTSLSNVNNENNSSDIHSVINTLFGSKNENSTSESNHRSRSPTPVIPGNGQIVCKLCGISVSCRKITNLSTHTLKLHCPIALWKCPSEGCTFDHADHGRVRSHIRHQHPGIDYIPIDNRSSEMVKNAEVFLKRCYPSVDFDTQHKNVIYCTEPMSLMIEKTKEHTIDMGALWELLAANENGSDMYTECSSCRISIPLNKPSVEDHIRQNHKADTLYQCGICEYANAEEWKVRVHTTIRHPDKPLASIIFNIQHANRIQLLVRKLFSNIADKMPADDVEVLINSFHLAGGPTVANGISEFMTDVISKSTTDENSVITMINTKSTIPGSPLLPLMENQEMGSVGETAVQNMLLQMFPTMESSNTNGSSVLRKSSIPSINRNERIVGKVECKMCSTTVETKRTMLVSHAKSHCTQRQWQCPHCETSAAFHSKLKLHIVNAHKSESEPIDLYSPSLENKWLLLFRQCFPQFSQQCFVEEWKFRSKQQQHYVTQLEEPITRNILEGCEQPRRSLLIEDDPPPLDDLSILNIPATLFKTESKQESL